MLLASAEPMELAAVVAYEHHVMLDGGGYPALHDARGAQYASMLVHVCDVYDALRTNRPYREAWESERALAYIKDRAGVEFDPGDRAGVHRDDATVGPADCEGVGVAPARHCSRCRTISSP